MHALPMSNTFGGFIRNIFSAFPSSYFMGESEDENKLIW
jgi:hypothetical protein